MAEAVLLYPNIEVPKTTDKLVSLFQLEGTDVDNNLKQLNSYLPSVPEDDGNSSLRSPGRVSTDDFCCTACSFASKPINQAVITNHVHCLKKLIRCTPNSIDISSKSNKGTTLVHIAARHGSLDVLKVLVETDRSLIRTLDYKGATPLHACAYYGNVACLRYLLQIGSSATMKDNDGATAVHFAAVSGHLDCLKELIETGRGDSNAKTNSGETPGMCTIV